MQISFNPCYVNSSFGKAKAGHKKPTRLTEADKKRLKLKQEQVKRYNSKKNSIINSDLDKKSAAPAKDLGSQKGRIDLNYKFLIMKKGQVVDGTNKALELNKKLGPDTSICGMLGVKNDGCPPEWADKISFDYSDGSKLEFPQGLYHLPSITQDCLKNIAASDKRVVHINYEKGMAE